MASSTLSLRAALTLLGDWDSELDTFLDVDVPLPPLVCLPLSNSPVETSNSPRKSSKRRRHPDERTAYQLKRDARQAAVNALHAQLRELSQELDRERTSLADRMELSCQSASQMQREWEQITARQKRQRVAVEAENRALQQVYTEQVTRAQRVVVLARKARAKLESVLGFASPPSINKYQGPILDIAQHLRYLDYRLDKARHVLSSDLFARQKCDNEDFVEISFRDHGVQGVQVEFSSKWTLPFSVDKVANTMWRQLTHVGHKGRTTDSTLAHASSDMMVTSFVSEPDPSGAINCNHGQPIAGASHGQVAARRFPATTDGSVYLLARIQAAILSDTGDPKGEMHGDCWILVEPVKSQGTKTTPHAARIKWCRRINGRLVDHATLSATERAQWIHSVVTGPMQSYWKKSLERNLYDVEHALLQRP